MLNTFENHTDIVPHTTVSVSGDTEKTVEAITYEFTHRRGIYLNRLIKNGIPPHELDDALGELFEMALRYAASFDPDKAQLQSWIGNAIGRSVASTTYGTRRPHWRRVASLECSIAERRSNAEEQEAVELSDGIDECEDVMAAFAVQEFMESLASFLTVNEMHILEKTGLAVLDRLTTKIRNELCQELDIAINVLNKMISSLREKLQRHAENYFDLDELVGREYFKPGLLYVGMYNQKH